MAISSLVAITLCNLGKEDIKSDLFISELLSSRDWGREWWVEVHSLLRKENQVLASAGVRRWVGCCGREKCWRR